jgi:hypothetical protein
MTAPAHPYDRRGPAQGGAVSWVCTRRGNSTAATLGCGTNAIAPHTCVERDVNLLDLCLIFNRVMGHQQV